MTEDTIREQTLPQTEQQPKALGRVLVEEKVISEEHLQAALELQKAGDPRRLGTLLIENGWLDPESLAMALSVHLNLPFIDLKRHAINRDLLEVVPEDFARRHHLIPLDIVHGAMAVVMEDPTDVQVIEELAALSGYPISPTVGTSNDIEDAIDLHYKAHREIEREVAEFIPVEGLLAAEELAAEEEALAQDPVVRAVDLILEQAVRDRASDIHLVPDHNTFRVRYRIDGILHDTLTLPKASHYPLISRIKILAGMNIAERRRPQDGQFSRIVEGEETFFRVATSDTTWGEMATVRVLGRSESILDIERLGMDQETMRAFRRLIQSPFGMVLVSGPTGSGKTTTLYAALNQLDHEHRNIMTIEDPVEYNFQGINQIQVNRAAEITFASGLRGVMRLDPDVIMVGEVRDTETAQAATQAALTGHLVLSSIHANDAPGAFYRLSHLGVERFLLTSAILGAISQRLVRRVCPHCVTMTRPTPEEREAYAAIMGEPLESYRMGEGCNYCGQTGYLGRTGVFELLVATEPIRHLFNEGASTDVLRAAAEKDGLVSMKQAGMMKVKQGITTPSEVIRNVYSIA